MKKLFALILICISSHLSAQVNAAPPKIITEIDQNVATINQQLSQAQIETRTDSIDGFRIARHFIWLNNGRIIKIAAAIHHNDNSLYYEEYFFQYSSIIQIRNSMQLKNIQFQNITPAYSPNAAIIDTFYYDYNELMSNPVTLNFTRDTIFIHYDMLRSGYKLLEKYKHLQNYTPFKNLKYDKVVAYDFDGAHEGRIIENGKLHPSTKKLQNKTLNKNQTDSLLTILADTSTFGGNHALCFEPRLGIVFYNGKKIVADINICFECNSLISSIYLPAEVHHKLIYGGDDYLNVLPQTGFSTIGRKQLKQLCHNLGLGLCPPMDDESMFDNIPTEDDE